MVEIDGHSVVALIARLDNDCSRADGRILVYRHRSIASHKLSAARSLQSLRNPIFLGMMLTLFGLFW